jgi:hypothetical protein
MENRVDWLEAEVEVEAGVEVSTNVIPLTLFERCYVRRYVLLRKSPTNHHPQSLHDAHRHTF